MPDGSPWPRVSIVTPSYNQGQFIEETIRSVLLQGYPNLEYIVIDGGSTDASVEIIHKYEPWLAYWVSEPDNGQADAINKGFAVATGSLIGWVNSDDVLVPSCLYHLAEAHVLHPVRILAGPVIDFDDDGYEQVIHQRGLTFPNFVKFWEGRRKYHMPGIFYPRALLEQVGNLDTSFRYLFDMDLMCRLLQIANVEYITEPLARFRLHPGSKTVSEKAGFRPEAIEISKRYWHLIEDLDERQFRKSMSTAYATEGVCLLTRGKIDSGIRSLNRSFDFGVWGVLWAAIRQIKNWILGQGRN
jgi:glycosyltransferase involved in cell wall biosynthesis